MEQLELLTLLPDSWKEGVVFVTIHSIQNDKSGLLHN